MYIQSLYLLSIYYELGNDFILATQQLKEKNFNCVFVYVCVHAHVCMSS